MIENLNKLTFHPYGTICKEIPVQPWVNVTVGEDRFTNFRAEAPTCLLCEKGMAVMSLSTDGKHFQKFYLDKPVKLQKGIIFGLCALREQAVVRCGGVLPPTELGQRSQGESLYVARKFHVERMYTLFYQEKEAGFIYPGEIHDAAELTYVDQGSLHCVIEGQDVLLQQGDMVLCGPNQWHMQYSDIGVAPRFMTVSFDMGQMELSHLYGQCFHSPQKTVALLQQMLREQENMDELSGDMLLCQLTMILLSLLRQSEDTPAEGIRSAHCISNENDIIRRAQQYISTNVRQRLTVPMVALHTDVSTSYLTSLFHKHLQISPGEYVRRVKLQESKQMIREGNMNFTEIAQALQYSTIHHFSRQFKEKFGITPTQYARSIR